MKIASPHESTRASSIEKGATRPVARAPLRGRDRGREGASTRLEDWTEVGGLDSSVKETCAAPRQVVIGVCSCWVAGWMDG